MGKTFSGFAPHAPSSAGSGGRPQYRPPSPRLTSIRVYKKATTSPAACWIANALYTSLCAVS